MSSNLVDDLNKIYQKYSNADYKGDFITRNKFWDEVFRSSFSEFFQNTKTILYFSNKSKNIIQDAKDIIQDFHSQKFLEIIKNYDPNLGDFGNYFVRSYKNFLNTALTSKFQVQISTIQTQSGSATTITQLTSNTTMQHTLIQDVQNFFRVLFSKLVSNNPPKCTTIRDVIFVLLKYYHGYTDEEVVNTFRGQNAEQNILTKLSTFIDPKNSNIKACLDEIIKNFNIKENSVRAIVSRTCVHYLIPLLKNQGLTP